MSSWHCGSILVSYASYTRIGWLVSHGKYFCLWIQWKYLGKTQMGMESSACVGYRSQTFFTLLLDFCPKILGNGGDLWITIIWLQLEWCRQSEVVGTLKSYLMFKKNWKTLDVGPSAWAWATWWNFYYLIFTHLLENLQYFPCKSNFSHIWQWNKHKWFTFYNKYYKFMPETSNSTLFKYFYLTGNKPSVFAGTQVMHSIWIQPVVRLQLNMILLKYTF